MSYRTNAGAVPIGNLIWHNNHVFQRVDNPYGDTQIRFEGVPTVDGPGTTSLVVLRIKPGTKVEVLGNR